MSKLITPYEINQVWTAKNGIEVASITDAHGVFVFDVYLEDADEILKRVNNKSSEIIDVFAELLAVAKTAKCPECKASDFDYIMGMVPIFKCPWCSLREDAVEKAELKL